eukprot:4414367-Alexandrium_andersonii.AAC.1
MSASLVGSEMCIRDSCRAEERAQLRGARSTHRGHREARRTALYAALRCPVSYTHLTLPTICSV